MTSNTSGSSTSTTLRHSGGIGSNGNMARSRRPLRRSSKRSPLRPMTSSLTCGACFKIRLKAGKRKASTPLSAAAIRKVRDKSAGSNTVGAESFSSRCNTSLMSGNNSRMRAVGTMRGPLLTKVRLRKFACGGQSATDGGSRGAKFISGKCETHRFRKRGENQKNCVVGVVVVALIVHDTLPCFSRSCGGTGSILSVFANPATARCDPWRSNLGMSRFP